jgi:hypothetical protein
MSSLYICPPLPIPFFLSGNRCSYNLGNFIVPAVLGEEWMRTFLARLSPPRSGNSLERVCCIQYIKLLSLHFAFSVVSAAALAVTAALAPSTLVGLHTRQHPL